MRSRRLVPVALALAGFAAVVIGIHQGLVHVAPGYEGTITTGWDGDPNHEERLLASLALLGVVGTAAARRWRRHGDTVEEPRRNRADARRRPGRAPGSRTRPSGDDPSASVRA